MGFESFQVEIRGPETNFSEIRGTVESLPNVKRDEDCTQWTGSSFYIVEDGHHAIELELRESPLKLSCRFTLCHPTSVDSAFLGLIRELMSRTGMTARICDDVEEADARSFKLAEFKEFTEIAMRCFAARRAEWIATFGDQPKGLTTSEVLQQIVLPRCQPVIKQPT